MCEICREYGFEDCSWINDVEDECWLDEYSNEGDDEMNENDEIGYYVVVYRRLDCDEISIVYMGSKKECWNRIVKMYLDYLRSVSLKLDDDDEMRIRIVKDWRFRVDDGFEYIMLYFDNSML